MKIDFNLQGRDDPNAIGITIKKENRSLLNLTDSGKLEAWETTPLSEKLTLLSLGDKNDQISDAINVTMGLVEMIEDFKRFDLQDVF